MTERSHRAPDPAEPSTAGLARNTADLSAVRRTDAIFDALATRRVAAFEPGSEPAPAPSVTPAPTPPPGSGDPAVRLLRALIADVDEAAGEQRPDGREDTVPAASPTTSPATSGSGSGSGGAGSGSRRRGSRTIVALGVAGAVLAGTGVAAAGSGVTHRSAPAPDKPGHSEDARSKGSSAEPKKPAPAPAPVARPAQGHERPGAKGSKDDPVRKQIEDLKQRLEDLLSPHPRPRGTHGNPWQPPAPHNDADETRKKLDDIRRQAQKRIDRYRNH